jgi:hypothetical protein
VAATNSLTRIAAFEEPPDLAGRTGTVVHRALRSDVRFRCVAVGALDAGDVYELVREFGTPDVEGGTVRIELFEVPDDEDERFLVGWERLRDALAQQRGYLGTRLYRSRAPADFHFVDITRWSSPLMVARALRLADVQAAIEALPFPSDPALYVVATDRP